MHIHTGDGIVLTCGKEVGTCVGLFLENISLVDEDTFIETDNTSIPTKSGKYA